MLTIFMLKKYKLARCLLTPELNSGVPIAYFYPFQLVFAYNLHNIVVNTLAI